MALLATEAGITTDVAPEDRLGPPEKVQRPVVILDTSVLLSEPSSLFAFPEADVVLPLTVIEELDGHKARLDDVGRAARHSARLIEQLRVEAGGDLREPVVLTHGGSLRIELNGLQTDALGPSGRPLLVENYESEVIAGPGAFVIAAQDRSDFARALLQKMVLEIANLMPAQIPSWTKGALTALRR